MELLVSLGLLASFNEAAGIPRGRQDRRRHPGRDEQASMRPRVFPAEDIHVHAMNSSPRSGFNEAAGIPRGRRCAKVRTFRSMRRFNEAAGIPRGRPGTARHTHGA